MEKTLNFSIFKEKIIKTNELLNVLVQKNKSLDQAQKWNQHLKTRLELSRNETNKLKLRNQTLEKNVTTVEKNYVSLKEEHETLKDDFVKLERESSNTINNLQINYQLTNQELRECKEKIAILQQQIDSAKAQVPESPAKIKKSPGRKRKDSVKKKDDHSNVQSENDILMSKIYEFQVEKEKLINENDKLNMQIIELKKQFSKKEEIFVCEINKLKETLRESKRQQEDLPRLDGDVDNEKAAQQTIDELSEKLKKQDDVLRTKQNELEIVEKKFKNVETDLEKLRIEHERLQDQNASYQVEIQLLRENAKSTREEIGEDNEDSEMPTKENCLENAPPQTMSDHEVANLRDNNVTPTDEEVSTILKQATFPSQLSPISESFVTCDEDIRSLSHTLAVPENCTTSPPNPNLKHIVNKRRRLKKRRLSIKKKSRHVDLLGALVALKNANINFIISGDSLMPSKGSFVQFSGAPRFSRVKIRRFERRTRELNCTLSCCKNSYMMLRESPDEEDASLLGFVEVKDEVSTQKTIEAESEQNNSIRLRKREKLMNKWMNGIDENTKGRTHVADIEHDVASEQICTETKSKKDVDEEYGSYNRREDSSGVIVNSETRMPRRSKRKRPVIKHKVSVNNTLAVTSYPLFCSDAPSDVEEEGVIPDKQRKSPASERIKPTVIKKSTVSPKSLKTSFKRPVCSTRRSLRLVAMTDQIGNCVEDLQQTKTEETAPSESAATPQSPTPSQAPPSANQPVLIPTTRAEENTGKMPTSKIEMLFNKLVVYSAEEKALDEVVREFSSQDPGYIAEAIVERVAMDYHEAPDTKYTPAPLMTHVQRTMLGFMSRLEKTNVYGVFDHYLTLAEQRILTGKELQQLGPITRLYLAVCKLQKKLTRMRKLCCDVFYFCGDYAIPFLFMVLTSWTEILPRDEDSKDMPIARVLVQIVLTKDLNKPGYNLLPLRDLLHKFYGYPTERWDLNDFFKELLYEYLRNPVRSSDLALLLYCKNRPEQWVYEKIEQHLKPIVDQKIADNFKATVIILIGNLYNRFSSKSDVNYLPRIREWFSGLITETTPDVVKRSVYLCLNRLKKK